MRTTSRGLTASLLSVALCCTLGGCAASTGNGPGASRSPTPSASATQSPRIPADGLTLAALGYRNGPVAEVSLPRTVVVTARVDQDNNVTAALSAPAAAEVADYLRRALPLAGFTVTADNENAAQPALTFRGLGWHGSFTGDDRSSAVLLRPG